MTVAVKALNELEIATGRNSYRSADERCRLSSSSLYIFLSACVAEAARISGSS